MKVVTDPARCMAAGYCEQIAPAVFVVDEEAGVVKVLVDEVEAGDEDDVREAETMCPNIAIRVIEDE